MLFTVENLDDEATSLVEAQLLFKAGPELNRISESFSQCYLCECHFNARLNLKKHLVLSLPTTLGDTRHVLDP